MTQTTTPSNAELAAHTVISIMGDRFVLIVIDIARIGAGLEPAGRAFLGKPASRAWGWEAAGKQPPSLPR
jgi:hypothetical protein